MLFDSKTVSKVSCEPIRKGGNIWCLILRQFPQLVSNLLEGGNIWCLILRLPPQLVVNPLGREVTYGVGF